MHRTQEHLFCSHALYSRTSFVFRPDSSRNDSKVVEGVRPGCRECDSIAASRAETNGVAAVLPAVTALRHLDSLTLTYSHETLSVAPDAILDAVLPGLDSMEGPAWARSQLAPLSVLGAQLTRLDLSGWPTPNIAPYLPQLTGLKSLELNFISVNEQGAAVDVVPEVFQLATSAYFPPFDTSFCIIMT